MSAPIGSGPAASTLVQRRAGEQLHDQVGSAAASLPTSNSVQDVGMIQRRGGARFAFEALAGGDVDPRNRPAGS